MRMPRRDMLHLARLFSRACLPGVRELSHFFHSPHHPFSHGYTGKAARDSNPPTPPKPHPTSEALVLLLATQTKQAARDPTPSAHIFFMAPTTSPATQDNPPPRPPSSAPQFLPIPALRASVSYTAGVPLHRQVAATATAQQYKEGGTGTSSGGEWRAALTEEERGEVRQKILAALKRQTKTYDDVLKLAMALQEEALYAGAPSRLDYIKNSLQIDRRLVEAKKKAGGPAAGAAGAAAAAAAMGGGGAGEEAGAEEARKGQVKGDWKGKAVGGSEGKKEGEEGGQATKRKVGATEVEEPKKEEAGAGADKGRGGRATRRSGSIDAQEQEAGGKEEGTPASSKTVEGQADEPSTAAALAAAAGTGRSQRKRARK